MTGPIPIEDLDFVTILQIHPTVAPFFGDPKLDVQSKVAELLLGDDIRRSKLSSGSGGVIRHHDRSLIHRIINHFPFDGQGRTETGPLPVSPFLIQQLAATVQEHLGTFNRLCPNTNMLRPEKLRGRNRLKTQNRNCEQNHAPRFEVHHLFIPIMAS